MMARFRKRPEVVEALQWNHTRQVPGVVPGPVNPSSVIRTELGNITLKAGDWIVWWAPGELPVVIDNETFHATYELVP